MRAIVAAVESYPWHEEPSAKQLDIKQNWEQREYLTLGKEKPNFWASLVPSRHSPPPTFDPDLVYQLPGLPMISHTLQTWSTSLPPGKRGFKVAISTAIAPIAHISTGAEYSPARSRTSGARYHRVDTYVVYGSLDCVSRASPKSAILIEYIGGVEGGVTIDEYRLKVEDGS